MIKTEIKFSALCKACGNTATSTTTNSKKMFIKWMRNLGWEVHEDETVFCSFHRTRKSPKARQGPTQLDLFTLEPAQHDERGTKW